MFDFFKRKKARIACVYAGPGYFRKKAKEAQKAEIDEVYAGPEPDPEPEDTDNNTAEYPANHEENNGAEDASCNSSEEADKQPEAEAVPYPESAKEENIKMEKVEPIRFVYAGPQHMNKPEEVFLCVYAGPQFETPKINSGAPYVPTQETEEPQPSFAEQIKQDEWLKTEGHWICPMCKTFNDAKFCKECGTPMKIEKWKCSCGAENIGIFCKECGSVKGKTDTWMV